jgi:hypothetical protein
MGEGEGGGGATSRSTITPFLAFPHKGGRDEEKEAADVNRREQRLWPQSRMRK